MTPEEAIKDSHEKWPMPEGEIKRLRQRRWVLELLPKGGIGAEIGVFRGHFSDLICEIAQPKKLYLIDPWTTIGETFGWGKAYTSFGQLPTSVAREDAKNHVRKHENVECVVIESVYPNCADQITEQLDWAYLDASHKYESTLQELRKMQEQVAPHGTILGDDWDIRPESPHHGVYLAVQAFVAETDWEVIGAGRGRQWAIRRKK